MNVRFVITTTSKINFIPQPSISDVSCKILQKCIRFHQLATIPTNVNRCGTYFWGIGKRKVVSLTKISHLNKKM